MITKNKRTYIQGDPDGLNKKHYYTKIPEFLQNILILFQISVINICLCIHIYTLIWVIIVIDRTWKTNVQDFYILN